MGYVEMLCGPTGWLWEGMRHYGDEHNHKPPIDGEGRTQGPKKNITRVGEVILNKNNIKQLDDDLVPQKEVPKPKKKTHDKLQLLVKTLQVTTLVLPINEEPRNQRIIMLSRYISLRNAAEKCRAGNLSLSLSHLPSFFFFFSFLLISLAH